MSMQGNQIMNKIAAIRPKKIAVTPTSTVIHTAPIITREYLQHTREKAVTTKNTFQPVEESYRKVTPVSDPSKQLAEKPPISRA